MNHDDIESEPIEQHDSASQRGIVWVTWATQINITARVVALLALVGFIFWLLLGQR